MNRTGAGRAFAPSLAAFLALLAGAGCSEPPARDPARPPQAEPSLSTDERDANAPAIAALFGQTCLAAAEDSGALADALSRLEWRFDALPGVPIVPSMAAWEFRHGELVHSAVELAPGTRMIDCELVVEAAVAPDAAAMRDALRPLIQPASPETLEREPGSFGWRWRSEGNEIRLTTGPERVPRAGAATPPANGAEARPGLAVHLSITSGVPEPPSLPPG